MLVQLMTEVRQKRELGDLDWDFAYKFGQLVQSEGLKEFEVGDGSQDGAIQVASSNVKADDMVHGLAASDTIPGAAVKPGVPNGERRFCESVLELDEGKKVIWMTQRGC